MAGILGEKAISQLRDVTRAVLGPQDGIISPPRRQAAQPLEFWQTVENDGGGYPSAPGANDNAIYRCQKVKDVGYTKTPTSAGTLSATAVAGMYDHVFVLTKGLELTQGKVFLGFRLYNGRIDDSSKGNLYTLDPLDVSSPLPTVANLLSLRLDPATNSISVEWARQLGNPIGGGLHVGDDGRLYATLHDVPKTNPPEVRCLDLSSGADIWSRTLGATDTYPAFVWRPASGSVYAYGLNYGQSDDVLTNSSMRVWWELSAADGSIVSQDTYANVGKSFLWGVRRGSHNVVRHDTGVSNQIFAKINNDGSDAWTMAATAFDSHYETAFGTQLFTGSFTSEGNGGGMGAWLASDGTFGHEIHHFHDANSNLNSWDLPMFGEIDSAGGIGGALARFDDGPDGFGGRRRMNGVHAWPDDSMPGKWYQYASREPTSSVFRLAKGNASAIDWNVTVSRANHIIGLGANGVLACDNDGGIRWYSAIDGSLLASWSLTQADGGAQDLYCRFEVDPTDPNRVLLSTGADGTRYHVDPTSI